MPCYHPLPAWRAKKVNTETGKRPITFRHAEAYTDLQVQLPCGNCIGCRLGRAQEWALRCWNESKQHRDSIFATLTYDNQELPPGGSLEPYHLRLFWQNLRRAGNTVRYFACGEYGETTERPHYHAIIFGYWPHDSERLPLRSNGLPLYQSASLTELWGRGFTSFAPVTQASAGYVAQYTLKKFKEDGTMEDFGDRRPPFLVMSRRPGIGAAYAYEHARYITAHDGIRAAGGKLFRIPRFYETVIERSTPYMKGLKRRRKEKAATNPDNTGSRLITREGVKKAQTTHLKERNRSL